ncbi:hypothetical protein I3760_13G100700 [Carya illinoinensis]|nr:hypothetical protein I3760_13G100700 [Carya illinoinensis]
MTSSSTSDSSSSLWHKYSHSSTSVSSLSPFQHFPYPPPPAPLPKDSRAMYTPPNTVFSRAADFSGLSTSQELTLPLALPSAPFLPPNLLLPDHLSASELDCVPDALRTLNSEVGNSSSCSGCSSYGSPNSLASQGPSFIQRSVSSHSLLKNGFRQLVSPTREFLDSDESPVRRVFSTGDLQRIKMVQRCHRSESPLSNENSIIIESMSKASKYSPEEKKERIERYRSKRNQRNFNKKIKEDIGGQPAAHQRSVCKER